MRSSSSHPRILPFLFLTEMWERFGFYIAQGLLVLYMTQQFGLSDDLTYSISGIFSALVYISPFIGGVLADRFLGFKTCILWGGAFLIVGYAILAISTTLLIFNFGLATIVIGNGLFKPNISSLLGTQYPRDSLKRDSGFTIFHVGINLGVALAGLSGYIKEYFGWHVTYALASVGMMIGVGVFLIGTGYIDVPTFPSRVISFTQKFQILFACIAAVFGINFLFHMHALTNTALPIAGLVMLIMLGMVVLRQKRQDQKPLLLLNVLVLSSIVFWMLFFQIFNSSNLYVSRLVEQQIFGIKLTPSLFWASESVYIFTLGPLFAWLWAILADRGSNPSPVLKFIIGILSTSLSFCILAISTRYPQASGLVHPSWVFVAYLFLTIGELLIYPIGLSSVISLAPEKLIGMMMGVLFVALGFGGYFGGLIAQIASVPVTVLGTAEKLAIYQHAFYIYAGIGLAVGFTLFSLNLLVKNGKNGIIAAKSLGED